MLASLQFLGQRDPFGRQLLRNRERDRERHLQETRKATAARIETLRLEKPDAANSRVVDAAIQDLKSTFGQMKPVDKSGNLKALTAEQKQIGELWRKISESQASKSLSDKAMDQSFGRGENDKAAEWTKELQEGKTEALKKELDSIKEESKKLEEVKDPAAKQAAQNRISQRMQDVADALKKNAGSPALQAAPPAGDGAARRRARREAQQRGRGGPPRISRAGETGARAGGAVQARPQSS